MGLAGRLEVGLFVEGLGRAATFTGGADALVEEGVERDFVLQRCVTVQEHWAGGNMVPKPMSGR